MSGFGSVQFALSFIDLFLPFIAFGYGGFGSIAIGRPESSPIPINKVAPTIAVLKLAQSLVALTIAALFLLLPRYVEYRTLVGALSFLFLSSALDTEYVHSGTQTLTVRNIFSMVSKGICLVGVILLVKHPEDSLRYGILTALPNALVVFLSLFFSVRKLPWQKPSMADLRTVFLQATPFGITTILCLLVERFDVFFVEAIGGSTAVGLYAGPLRVVQSIATAATMVSAIYFSELVRIKDPRSFSRHVEFSILTAALVLAPVAVGAWFVGDDLLATVFAATYSGRGPIPGYVLGILSCGVVATVGINAFGLQVLWLKHNLKPLNWIYFFGLLGGCSLATLLGWKFGVIGVAASVLIAKLGIAIGCYFFARPFLPEFSWAFALRISAACIAMGGVLAAIGPNYSVWTRIAAGAVTYGVATGLLFRHEWPRVIKSLRRS